MRVRHHCPVRTTFQTCRAFTLLELLVAAFAASVLMVALLTVMSVSWKLQERARERQLADAPRDAALQQLRAELRAAVVPNGLLADLFLAETEESGEVRLDRLEFVTATGGFTPDALGGDLVRLAYYLVESDKAGEYDLVRAEQANVLVVEVEEAEELVMLRGVASFELTFYDGTDWTDGWDSSVQENELPLAIHVRLTFAPRAGQTPPPLELTLPFEARSVASGGTGS